MIRALDGIGQGASVAEVGRVLFGDHGDPRRSAQRALLRAREISVKGYRELLLLAP